MDKVVVRTARWRPLLATAGLAFLAFMISLPPGVDVTGRWAWIALFAVLGTGGLVSGIWPTRLIISEWGIEQVHLRWRLRLSWKQIDQVLLRNKQIVLVLTDGPWGRRHGVGAWFYQPGEQPLAMYWTLSPARMLELLRTWQAKAGRPFVRDDR